MRDNYENLLEAKTKEELYKVKEEFLIRWKMAVNFIDGHKDLPNHKTYQEWIKKWDRKVDDDAFYEIAGEYYGHKGEL